MSNLKKNNFDFLIIGQGLVGSWMSYYLNQAGQSCVVINQPSIPAASRIASGVINPVTGRRIVQTWMIETFLPFAKTAYTSISKMLHVEIIKEMPILLIHPSLQMQESFNDRMQDENIYLSEPSNTNTTLFNTAHGTGQINESCWIDLNQFLDSWKKYLISTAQYREEKFDNADVKLTEQGVQWKDLHAKKIIFCDGLNSMQVPYFNKLPFAPNKGEALIVEIPALSSHFIYKHSVSIVPWKEKKFWVGSNYEWQYKDDAPSKLFLEKTVSTLNGLLKTPYKVVDHITGVRPANQDRRPFVGLHPLHPQIGICNGMGTKGCSIAPYFAAQLVANILTGSPIHPEASLERFNKLLIL